MSIQQSECGSSAKVLLAKSKGEVELQLVLSSQLDTASMIWLGLQSVCRDLATRNSNLFILFMRDVPM